MRDWITLVVFIFIFLLVSCVPATNKKCKENQILVNGACVLKEQQVVLTPTPTVTPTPVLTITPIPTPVPTILPQSNCGNIASGAYEVRTMYQAAAVNEGQTCISEIQNRKCTNGQFGNWSGTYTQSKCLVSRVRYESSTVNSNTTCKSETQFMPCENAICGVWIPNNYIHATCSLEQNSNLVGLTDTLIHPRPSTPPLFNLNHKTIDPTFKTTIVRVTGPIGSNAVFESIESQNFAPIQHFHNPWNCTGDMFLVWANRLSEGGPAGNDLYTLDKKTFTVSRLRRVITPAAVMNYNRGIKWATDPSIPESDRKWIVYAVDSSKTPHTIKKWNLDPLSSHNGLAPSSSITLLSDNEGIDQLTVSYDDNHFSYYTSNKKIKVWVKSTETLYTVDLSSWYLFDESQLTPDGKFVFAKGHEIQGQDYTVRFDYTLTSKVNYSSYSGLPPDDFAGKHSGYGDWWINETTQSGYKLARRKPSSEKGAPDSYIFTRPNNGGGTMHPSYSTSDYVYGGMFTIYPYNPTKVYEDEILMIKTDGTLVIRLAHAWSNFFSNSYDEIPSYSSPDNKYVLFYTNWNGASATARHDVFIVATPI